MTTPSVIEKVSTLIHGEFCECSPCRAAKGLRPTDPNDDLGFTTSDDGEGAW